MRQAFAHEATVVLTPGGDPGAPGAAITVALCGSWDHDPPCPLAAHHTRAVEAAGELRLRTLFVAEPAQEATVRSRIEAGLTTGGQAGPDGRHTGWELRASRPSEVHPDETDHAHRLLAG